MLTVVRGNQRWSSSRGWVHVHELLPPERVSGHKDMALGNILAINEYMVFPGFGFDMHPQLNLEHIYMVCEGALSHEDSLGNKATLAKGCAQRIVGGSGYARKLHNHSRTPARLVMVLLHSESGGESPVHEIKQFASSLWVNSFCRIASGMEQDSRGCARPFIHVNSRAEVLIVSVKNTNASFKTGKESVSLLYVIDGEVTVNGTKISEGSYAVISKEDGITVHSQKRGKCLLVQSFPA